MGLTAQEKKSLPKWLEEVKSSSDLSDHAPVVGGLPGNLNDKQFGAFAIIHNFIHEVLEKGLDNVPPLLLNISGAAGTGKTFWLNTVKRFVRTVLHLDSAFITAAAPSGTAAYLIGGETLHSLLYLPVGQTKLEKLQGDRLKDLQLRFKEVGILVIDEKSMIGQNIFYNVSERLKQARPHACDQPFEGLSVILLGDWKQLPPDCDYPLYNDKAKRPLGQICTSFSRTP